MNYLGARNIVQFMTMHLLSHVDGNPSREYHAEVPFIVTTENLANAFSLSVQGKKPEIRVPFYQKERHRAQNSPQHGKRENAINISFYEWLLGIDPLVLLTLKTRA
jgi:hypothetical protein